MRRIGKKLEYRSQGDAEALAGNVGPVERVGHSIALGIVDFEAGFVDLGQLQARDTAEQQLTLARAIYRDHLSSFARMMVVLGLQLTAR